MADYLQREEFVQTLENIKRSVLEQVSDLGVSVESMSLDYSKGDFQLFISFMATKETFMTDQELEAKDLEAQFNDIIMGGGLEDPEEVVKNKDKLNDQVEEVTKEIDGFFD